MKNLLYKDPEPDKQNKGIRNEARIFEAISRKTLKMV